MDWAKAIERNREPLLRIVATLFAMMGLTESGAVERVSRPVYRAVLGVLRPAEAAVRRLIIVAARGMVVKPRQRRPAPAGLKISGKGQGRVSFRLFDPPRQPFEWAYGLPARGRRPEPRIHFFGPAFDPRIPLLRQLRPEPAASTPDEEENTVADDTVADDTINAIPLCRRLAAIKRALEDLPREARRFARWRARPVEARRPQLSTPLRRGPPPGRRKPTHEVDEILARCHWIAWEAMKPNTS
jgi:hypothetical protein